MAIDVVVYHLGAHHRRSTLICQALMDGIKRAGDRPRLMLASDYSKPVAPVVAFYGFTEKLQQIMADYRAGAGRAVYVDLGYWERHHGGRWTGYHKVSVNGRHPTEYFQRVKHAPDRAQQVNVKVLPWKDRGRHILLAGMSDKGAIVEGFAPEQWERETIAALQKVTDRPIVYRPKPSWKGARPIEGTSYSGESQTLKEALRGCHAVVTHHSNVAVDGIVAGIPAFCVEGAALPMSSQDLSQIEAPSRPADRQQWVNDLAYTQWSVAEIARGIAWKHLKSEALIP